MKPEHRFKAFNAGTPRCQVDLCLGNAATSFKAWSVARVAEINPAFGRLYKVVRAGAASAVHKAGYAGLDDAPGSHARASFPGQKNTLLSSSCCWCCILHHWPTCLP